MIAQYRPLRRAGALLLPLLATVAVVEGPAACAQPAPVAPAPASDPASRAWLGAQRCIVPMMAFHQDDWRSGKAVPTRIARVDGKPMGIAGLWERWSGAQGEEIVSFCLLTVNANSHALMHRYGQPGSEKRMLAILNEGAYGAWLNAPHPEKARDFMRAYPAQGLTANPIEKKRAAD